jgi:pyruvate ferredoxin oxidoreductase gamma subunit
MTLHCQVTNPAVVAVVDPTLIETVDVTDGATLDAVFVINTQKSPAELRKKLGLKKTQKVFSVDANRISIETIGRVMPNTPMLGALTKATGVINLDTLLKDIRASFGKKFSEKIINNNLDAARRAYEEVVSE